MSSELDAAAKRLAHSISGESDYTYAVADLRLVLAALARKHTALVWARKYTTGFDHLELCIVHAHPHVRDRRPCDCGYDDFEDSLDAAIAATDALAATEGGK